MAEDKYTYKLRLLFKKQTACVSSLDIVIYILKTGKNNLFEINRRRNNG